MTDRIMHTYGAYVWLSIGVFLVLVAAAGCSSTSSGPQPDEPAVSESDSTTSSTETAGAKQLPRVMHDADEADHKYPSGAPADMKSMTSPFKPGDGEAVGKGRALFQENCSRCHGAAGDGSGPDGEEMDPPPADFTEPHFSMMPDPLVYYIITTGIEGSEMPAWSSLPADDRWRIISYIRTLSPAMTPGGGGQGGMNH